MQVCASSPLICGRGGSVEEAVDGQESILCADSDQLLLLLLLCQVQKDVAKPGVLIAEGLLAGFHSRGSASTLQQQSLQ